jgi:microcompartment protein CcmK/EutM
MFIGKVTGNVVASQKTASFIGSKLLLVEAYSAEAGEKPGLKATGRFLVVVDSVGAGEGEFVLVTQGSSARLTKTTGDMPVDAVAVGIIDSIHIGAATIYKDHES